MLQKVIRMAGIILVSGVLVSCSAISQYIPSSLDISKQETEKPIPLESFASLVKGSLASPTYQNMTVDTIVPISGQLQNYPSTGHFAWIQIDFLGQNIPDLPSRFDEYIPIKNGKFAKQIKLFAGQGKYKVTIRIQGENEADQYYPFASFQITNSNTQIQRDIGMSMMSLETGLSIDQPTQGYNEADGKISLTGSVPEGSKLTQLMVQVKKQNMVFKKLVPIRDHRFSETVPLMYGKGVHQVQLMIPDDEQSNTFLEGASFYVTNTSSVVGKPIIYSNLYDQRGVKLRSPIMGGAQVQYESRIAGQIDPKAKEASQTEYMVVQTAKGKNKATYFIPVENYQFNGPYYLRFGPGTYKISVYVPEITTENRDFFRFYTVAEYEVESKGTKDLRDLLPSRGIQSDDPTIKNLAKEVTAGSSTDRERAKKIYDYVAKRMTYDMSKFRNNSFLWDDSALKALQTKKGVCQDYAFLAIALLRASDIPSRFVEGKADNQRHAWVESWIDGKWVVMDPTWGSGYISPNGSFIKQYDPTYFDPKPAYFQKTHTRTGIVY